MARTTIRTDDITATGTASSSTYLRGDGVWGEVASGGIESVQTFTSSGTWTRPTGITKVRVFVTGAGGGGKSVTGNFGGGGGGGTAIKLLDVSSISSATITIGSGGSATNDGGDSTWSDGTNTITGNGGRGATSSTGNGGSGGSASGGDINHEGGFGSYYTAGMGGGSSFWGAYGHSNGYDGSNYTAGNTPTIPGNGTLGWYSSITPPTASDGFIYVEEYK